MSRFTLLDSPLRCILIILALPTSICIRRIEVAMRRASNTSDANRRDVIVPILSAILSVISYSRSPAEIEVHV